MKINTDSPEVKKLAELSRKFFENEGYYIKWSTQRIGNPRFRILTISEKIETSKQIVPLEEIYSLIDKSRTICVMPCPCRSRHDIEGIRKCNYPVETCLTFNLYAESLLTMNDQAVRQLTKEEAKKVLRCPVKVLACLAGLLVVLKLSKSSPHLATFAGLCDEQ